MLKYLEGNTLLSISYFETHKIIEIIIENKIIERGMDKWVGIWF